MAEESEFVPVRVALAAGVFAERDGKILVMRRAVGELTGAWYVPGGALEEGESPEEGALRELREETGLVPSGPLIPVSHAILPVYGGESLQAFFAASCETGEIAMDHEHSEFRWIDAREYRDRYLSDDVLAHLAKGDERVARIVRGVRGAFDHYLAHLERAHALERLRERPD